MTDRPPSPDEGPRAEPAPSEAPRTVAADFLRNGHGWVAALASISGVLVTVLIATGVIGRPAAGPSPSPLAGPGSSAVAGATATPTQSSAASTSSASRTPRPATGRAEDVTSPDQLTAVLAEMGLPDAASYTYETIVDDVSGLTIEVPVEWEEGDFSSWLAREDDTRLGPLIVRTTDLGSLYDGFDTPGIFFGATTHYLDLPDGETILDEAGAQLHGYCPSGGSAAYEDDAYELGWYEVFIGCADEASVVLQLAARARDGTHDIYLHLRMTSTADIEAVVRALGTFALDDPTARSEPEA